MGMPGRGGVALVTDLLAGRRVGGGGLEVGIQAAEKPHVPVGGFEVTLVGGLQDLAADAGLRKPFHDRVSRAAP